MDGTFSAAPTNGTLPTAPCVLPISPPCDGTLPTAPIDQYLQQVVYAGADDTERCVRLSQCVAYGRSLVAARHIPAGEVLFAEVPLVVAPQAGAGPICLRCLRNLPSSTFHQCTGCRAPVCPQGLCENMHHHQEECQVLAGLEEDQWTGRAVPLLNAALTPLRTWLTIKNSEHLRPVVMTMQSDSEKRQMLPIGKFIDAAIVPMLQKRFKCSIDRDFIHHACGIFDTNAFKMTNTGRNDNGRALLPMMGMLMHDCTPNTDHWFTEGKCVVRASSDIPPGARVTNNYTSCLVGTQSRLKHLSFTKLFTCKCARCLDPTEHGTHISSIRCRSCEEGLLVPPSDDTKDTAWCCNTCDASLPAEMAATMARAASCTTLLGDVDEITARLVNVQKMVGKQHHGTRQLLTALLRTIRKQPVTERSVEHLQECVAVTEELLPVARILAPGLSLYTGELLLGNLEARAELRGRGVVLAPSSVLQGGLMPPPDLQVVQERLKLCQLIHQLHPLSAAVEEVAAVICSN